VASSGFPVSEAPNSGRGAISRCRIPYITSIHTARLIHTFTRQILSDFAGGSKHFCPRMAELQCR
jgi:hypothetical protein